MYLCSINTVLCIPAKHIAVFAPWAHTITSMVHIPGDSDRFAWIGICLRGSKEGELCVLFYTHIKSPPFAKLFYLEIISTAFRILTVILRQF